MDLHDNAIEVDHDGELKPDQSVEKRQLYQQLRDIMTATIERYHEEERAEFQFE